jgi:hypothetical protein
LDYYDELVSKGVQYGKNCEERYPGGYIYTSYNNGAFDKQIMGRALGLRGAKLRQDIISGNWQEQPYETSSETQPFNRNWFYIKDFVKLVDQMQVSV